MRELDLKTVSKDGKWLVSTVSLAGPARVLDGLFFPERHVDIAETMVFPADADGTVSDWTERYRLGYGTLTEAEAGHEVTVVALDAGQLALYGAGN